MTHFKISFATLLTGLFFTCANSAYSQSEIHREIRPTTTEQEIELLKSDLQKEGITLKVTQVKRLRGKIRKIALRVESGEGSVTYRSSPFSGIVIERNENLCIGVKSLSE